MYKILIEEGYTHEEACYYIEEYCGTSKLSPREEVEHLVKIRSFGYE